MTGIGEPVRGTPARARSRLLFASFVLAGALATLVASAFVYAPDRPVPTLAPGASSAPEFVVQIRRPRLGLPLGGVVPPGWFGFEERLVFGSESPEAAVGRVGPQRVELRAEGWDLALVLDGEGRVSADTRIEFELVFEERLRRVRCAPGEAAVGEVEIAALADGKELWGRFEIELARCEDAATGAPLGWPPKPLVLHGSFDRLPLSR